MITVVDVVCAVLGWTGAGLSLAAYFLVSTGRIAPRSLRYHALNVCACALLAFACCMTRAWPSMMTNIVFVFIGMGVAFSIRRERSQVGNQTTAECTSVNDGEEGIDNAEIRVLS